MEKQTIGQGLIVALLGLGAVGLLARETNPGHTINLPFPERATLEGNESGGPRECDLQRGIETRCTFI